jgi:hypothetical protein
MPPSAKETGPTAERAAARRKTTPATPKKTVETEPRPTRRASTPRPRVQVPAQASGPDTRGHLPPTSPEGVPSTGQGPEVEPSTTWIAPPNWPAPPAGWSPPPGWQPDPAWGPPPAGWNFYPKQTSEQAQSNGYGYMSPTPAPSAWQPVVPAKRWFETKRGVAGIVVGLVVLVAVIAGVAGSSGGSSYSGTDLAADVTRTLSDNGFTATDVSCPDVTPAKDKIADCEATVDGETSGIRVTFQDADGHFILNEESLP